MTLGAPARLRVPAAIGGMLTTMGASGNAPLDVVLHHVQLAMPRGAEDVARAFYGDLLGLDEMAKPPALAARGGVWFRTGGLQLHLGVEEPFAPARKAHPGILVRDPAGFDALIDRLRAAGVDVRPDALFPGHRRCYIDDCFGNRLELLTPAEAGHPPRSDDHRPRRRNAGWSPNRTAGGRYGDHPADGDLRWSS